jgi:SOS-response transcriptional repressor LexA
MHVRNLVSVPLFHATGCNSQMIPTTQLGGTTVIMPTFEAQAFLRAAVDEQINILTSAPAIFWLAMSQPNFAEFDLGNVGWVTYGGAPTAPDVIGRLRSSFPNARLANGFGLTETSSVSTCLPNENAELRPETVGFAAPPVEVDLLDPDPTTGVGELVIRGQNVVAGYWNKPDKSAETFVDGWLHTGDLARIDEEGFVQIVDRLKDMINRGGENVYCVEVENALMRHPAVFEVAVLGVPDQMMGEKVGAAVVLRPGMDADARDICAFAKEHIADFKVPQYVSFRAEPLPRNAGGKVLKPVLRDETIWGEQLRLTRPIRCLGLCWLGVVRPTASHSLYNSKNGSPNVSCPRSGMEPRRMVKSYGARSPARMKCCSAKSFSPLRHSSTASRYSARASCWSSSGRNCSARTSWSLWYGLSPLTIQRSSASRCGADGWPWKSMNWSSPNSGQLGRTMRSFSSIHTTVGTLRIP